MEKNKELEEFLTEDNDIDVSDINMTDPIYVIDIEVTDKSGKILKSDTIGEFQYMSQSSSAFNTLKEDIDEVKEGLKDLGEIRLISLTHQVKRDGEVIEFIEQFVKNYKED